MRVSYNEKRFLGYGVTFLSFQGIYECIIPLTMLKILLFVLFIWVWWHFTLKDSNRDVVDAMPETLHRLVDGKLYQ